MPYFLLINEIFPLLRGGVIRALAQYDERNTAGHETMTSARRHPWPTR